MSIGQRFIYTVRDIFILIAAAGLILPPFTYSKNAPPPTAEEDEDGPGQGDEHRADPCDHLPDPPGKAKGIDKRCPPPLGSSGGVARGDFNGDGIGDLAVGAPFEDLEVVLINPLTGLSAANSAPTVKLSHA